ncbi:MAG TPA: sulfite exporter TauE/SafE family protein [Spirochaetota bacterium]|nr:sulfite exporter TauE/SafE family protein [Spirochaetota bacterium]HQL43210.1 sulfite exporter TauE/SafE family protein [Spirochaetota bacterium]
MNILPEQYIISFIIIFFSALVQAVTSFGSALVSMSFLPLLLPLNIVTPLVALNGTFITALNFLRLHQHFDPKKIKPLVIGALPGIPVGIYLLVNISEEIIKTVLAIVILAYSLYSLLHSISKIKINAKAGLLLGFFAGCLAGAFNTDGPPVVIYITSQKWSKDEMNISLSSYFLISGITLVTMHTTGGLITKDIVYFFIATIPATLLGVIAGSFIYKKINHETFQKIVLILLIIVAVMLIVQVHI